MEVELNPSQMHSGVTRARELMIYDSKQRVRAALGLHGDAALLALCDANAVPRLMIRTPGEGEPELELRDSQGRTCVVVSVDPDLLDFKKPRRFLLKTSPGGEAALTPMVVEQVHAADSGQQDKDAPCRKLKPGAAAKALGGRKQKASAKSRIQKRRQP